MESHFVRPEWCEKSRISIINAEKTKLVIFNQHNISTLHSKTRHHWHLEPSFLAPHRISLKQVSNFKYLGVLLDDTLFMTPLEKKMIASNDTTQALKQQIIDSLPVSTHTQKHHSSPTSPHTHHQTTNSAINFPNFPYTDISPTAPTNALSHNSPPQESRDFFC